MAGAAARSSPLHVRFGEFELDEANALLLRGGSSIALSPTPFGLLCALARRPGTLLTKHALLDEVWGHQFVSDSVLKGAISDVRAALGDDPQHPRFIETVPRRGYRFIAVRRRPLTAPPRVHRAAQASASAHASAIEPPHDSFVGRAKELASLRRAWDRVTQWQARRVLDRRRARHRQDNADRSLRFRTARRDLRAWPLRAALRKRRTVSSRPRSPRGAVPH